MLLRNFPNPPGSNAAVLEPVSPLLVEDLGRLALAAALGGVVGVERRFRAQPAGMRTQMVIAAACCFTMEMSRGPLQADPGRVIQAVLTGIGFLGGGAILRTGLSIHGLTTAASIWASATIGIAVGAGLLVQALVLTALVAGGLLALTPLESFLTGRRELRRIVVDAREAGDLLEQVRSRLGAYRVRLDEVGLIHNLEQKRLTLTLVAACPERIPYPDLVRDLGQIPGVVEIRIE